MAKLTASQRNSLPDSSFAGPGRSYPIPDASHAQFAEAMATKQYHKGALSKEAMLKIKSKAKRKLKKSKRGK